MVAKLSRRLTFVSTALSRLTVQKSLLNILSNDLPQTLTGESDKVFAAAAISLHPEKTMFEAPAVQVLTELIDDKGGYDLPFIYNVTSNRVNSCVRIKNWS